MPRQVFRVNCLAFLLTLSFASCRAQTLSNCRPTPPLPPNAKPGVGGLSLTRDGQTLVVAGGDAKISFRYGHRRRTKNSDRTHQCGLSKHLQLRRKTDRLFEPRSHREDLGCRQRPGVAAVRRFSLFSQSRRVQSQRPVDCRLGE